METRTRNVKQAYRRFSDENRKEIVMNIINRPSDMSLDDACMVYGIRNPQYYEWKQKFGIVSPPRKRVTPTTTRVFSHQFSEEQKRSIINEVENHPRNVTKLSIMKKYGVVKPQYYDWRRRIGCYGSVVKTNVNSVQPTSLNTIRKTIHHTITLNVEVSSLIELIGFCNHIGQLPEVKTILSIE